MIKMPKLDTRVFHKIQLYPILHNKQQIFLTNQMYLLHGNESYIVQTLVPTIFTGHDMKLDTSTCIPRLLTGKPAVCNYTANPVTDQIFSLDEKNLLINSDTNFTLSSDCNSASNRQLSGSYVISYNNCQVYINNVLHSVEVTNLPGSPLQLSLNGISVEKHKEIVNISLEHLHNLHLETRKELDYLRLSTGSLSWPHWTILGGIATSPFLVCIVVSLTLYIRRKPNIKVQINPTQNQSPQIVRKQHIRTLRPSELFRMEPQL